MPWKAGHISSWYCGILVAVTRLSCPIMPGCWVRSSKRLADVQQVQVSAHDVDRVILSMRTSGRRVHAGH